MTERGLNDGGRVLLRLAWVGVLFCIVTSPLVVSQEDDSEGGVNDPLESILEAAGAADPEAEERSTEDEPPEAEEPVYEGEISSTESEVQVVQDEFSDEDSDSTEQSPVVESIDSPETPGPEPSEGETPVDQDAPARSDVPQKPIKEMMDTDAYRLHERLALQADQLAVLNGVQQILTVAEAVSGHGNAAVHVLEGADLTEVIAEMARAKAQSDGSAAVTTRELQGNDAPVVAPDFEASQVAFVSESSISIRETGTGEMRTAFIGEKIRVGNTDVLLVGVERLVNGWSIEIEVNGVAETVRIR